MLAGGTDWGELTVPGAFVLGFVVACAVLVKLIEYVRKH